MAVPEVNIFVILAIGLAFILIGILLIPNVKKARKRKREQMTLSQDQKDWKSVCLRLEKYIQALRKRIVVLEKKERTLEGELAVQKEKYTKVYEKLSQERGWKSKESEEIKKKTAEVMQLKKEISRVEQSLTKELGQKIRLEREVKELQNLADTDTAIKRSLEAEIARLKAQIDALRKEMQELREFNAKLNKKNEEATFIGKSEYNKLERKLRAKETEFERFKAAIKNERG